jgi:hypothetical protein
MNIDINIFILCHNEQVLLPLTVDYYKNIFPNSIITIYDNESSDNSVEIAKTLGCNVISWSSNNQNNVFMKADISNNCWKSVKSGWIISIDMDEWLCITEESLIQEQLKGTTVLQTQGIEMIGECSSPHLKNFNIGSINRGIFFDGESKCVCFFRPSIKEMNYISGCHKCTPIGNVKFSSTIYVIKHFSYLGLQFIINKSMNRYARSRSVSERFNMSKHYKGDVDAIKSEYYDKLCSAFLIEKLYSSNYFIIPTDTERNIEDVK